MTEPDRTEATTDIDRAAELRSEARDALQEALYEIKRVIVGQDAMLERLLVSLLTHGHVLLEGVPGLAKTLTVKTLAQVLGGTFHRIQFTPDLVPADLVGTRIYRPDSGKLAYGVDLTGYRQYTLQVKDLATGALAPDKAVRVTSTAWAADNKTLFYVQEDDVTGSEGVLHILFVGGRLREDLQRVGQARADVADLDRIGAAFHVQESGP